MSSTLLDRLRSRSARSRPEIDPPGLPLIRLPPSVRLPDGPRSFFPQGSGGSVLIALGPALRRVRRQWRWSRAGARRAGASGERSTSGTAALFFDAQRGEWIDAHLELAGGGADGAHVVRTRGVQRAVERTSGWAFVVPPDGGEHPLALRELEHFSHEALSIDPRTGFFRVTDDEGFTSGFHRLRSRTQCAWRLEHGAVFETLQVKRTEEGDLSSVPAGGRLAVRWIPVATLEGNERWLFVSLETPGVPFAIIGAQRPGEAGPVHPD